MHTVKRDSFRKIVPVLMLLLTDTVFHVVLASLNLLMSGCRADMGVVPSIRLYE